MNNLLIYNGFISHIVIDFEAHLLFGKIINISDYVDFQSDSIDGIIKEFHSAVDDYLEFCKKNGKQPAFKQAI